MKTNPLVKAKYFVLTHGEDCDGFFTPECTPFTTRASAEYCQEKRSYSGDGQRFELADETRAREYCDEYFMTLPTQNVWDDIWVPKNDLPE